jgi:hypothetical protein
LKIAGLLWIDEVAGEEGAVLGFCVCARAAMDKSVSIAVKMVLFMPEIIVVSVNRSR